MLKLPALLVLSRFLHPLNGIWTGWPTLWPTGAVAGLGGLSLLSVSA